MRTLYLERSVSTGRNGAWASELDLHDVDRIVVGIGPGSFAGIRSALAFAKGFAIGRSCEVLGLPSPCALAANHAEEPLAVIGDARGGQYWIALFDGFKLVCPVFQVSKDELHLRVPLAAKVVTPDAARIDELLKEIFAERYLGGEVPTDDGLRRFAEANPKALQTDPLPIYLNPAVRAP